MPRTGGYVSLDSLTDGIERAQFVPPNAADQTVDEIFAARLRLPALSAVQTRILAIEDDALEGETAL